MASSSRILCGREEQLLVTRRRLQTTSERLTSQPHFLSSFLPLSSISPSSRPTAELSGSAPSPLGRPHTDLMCLIHRLLPVVQLFIQVNLLFAEQVLTNNTRRSEVTVGSHDSCLFLQTMNPLDLVGQPVTTNVSCERYRTCSLIPVPLLVLSDPEPPLSCTFSLSMSNIFCCRADLVTSMDSSH